MPTPAPNPYPPEALEANRRGELSEAQRRGFGALSRYGRRNAFSIAAYLVAGALLVAFFASPTASPVLRALIPVICLAIAAFLVVRSITGGDPLTRDLRQARVQSVEGAIGKNRMAGVGGGRSVTTHFLEVGDASFKVSPAWYAAAPDAGFVRLYFLPHSRKVVNLERLPNPPAPSEVTPRGIAASLGAALLSSDQRQRNEARAGLAGLGEALGARFTRTPVAPPPQARDPRPLGEAILGTWTNGVMKVTFLAGGAMTMDTFGARRTAHWSVDANGRLRAEMTGGEQAADAWVAGDQLTIAAEDGGMILTREPGA